MNVSEALRAAVGAHQAGDLVRAEELYRAILAGDANQFDALHLLGVTFAQRGDFAKAVGFMERALAVRPGEAGALYNLGNALLPLKRTDAALACFDQVLALHPDHADAHNNRGNALQDLGRPEEALGSYDRAIGLRPDYAEAHNNRGNVLISMRRLDEALESFDRSLAINPDSAHALFNRGHLLQDLKRLDEAIFDFHRMLSIDPAYPLGLGAMYYAKRHASDWRDYDKETTRVLAECRAGNLCATPWQFLAFADRPQDQFDYGRAWRRAKLPASPSPLWRGEIYDHARIRVAYLSADFHDHPLAWLMSGLFEHHDRSRFETIAISFGPDRPSPIRTRLENAFKHFIDARRKSSREIAALLRDMEVDIAIDRKGYTRDRRTEIFALRPAPIQVNYLAYPGTMGADYMDYIIADRFVIPEDHQQHFSEHVAYLPDSYQANDSRRAIAEAVPSRAQVGLPEEGFVFACFNNNYKITPRMFDIWMRLLREVEGSVLWLLEANDASSRNLCHEAQQRGVAPARLVFAPFMGNAEHLARLRLADLFMDTLPFNAHTTASDALWAGLPVVTCMGNTFAGRVGGGLLNAVGLPELITNTLEDYEGLILALARDGARLSGIRSRLAQNRARCPLFDTARYTRNLERAYEEMWARHQRGEPPAGFAVAGD